MGSVIMVPMLVKLFIALCLLAFVFSIFLTLYTHSKINSVLQNKSLKSNKDSAVKYILFWNSRWNGTESVGDGQNPFIKYNCLHKNCFITNEKEYLEDYTYFHAIVFDATDLQFWNRMRLPLRRSWTQKYVFFSKTPADEVHICNDEADTYFNWTWTYKLGSDIVSPFFKLHDLNGDIVAPRVDVVWRKNISESFNVSGISEIKKRKTIVSIRKKCDGSTDFPETKVVNMVRSHLQKDNLQYDAFGCEFSSCFDRCFKKKIKDHYFFYWVNDGSYAEDFVTDDIMTAIKTNTVPVVSGLSEYSFFLPPGSYVNTRDKTPANFAALLYYTTRNPEAYYKYFSWKKYYTLMKTPKFEGLCELCSKLNNKTLMENRNNYIMLRSWWNPSSSLEKCADYSEDSNLQSLFLSTTIIPEHTPEYEVIEVLEDLDPPSK